MTSAMKLFFSSSFARALRRGRFGGGACLAEGRAQQSGRGVGAARGLRARRVRGRGLAAVLRGAAAAVVGVVALGALGSSQAQAQTCTLDVARGSQRTTPMWVYTRNSSLTLVDNNVNLGFTVSPGCSSVVQTGPLRIAYYVVVQNATGAMSLATNFDGGLFGSNQGTQPTTSNRGTAAANGRHHAASYWEFTAAEVQSAATNGTTLNIPLRLSSAAGNTNGFRYALARTCNNRDSTGAITAGPTGSATSSENSNIRIATGSHRRNDYWGGRAGRCSGFDASSPELTASTHPTANAMGYLLFSDFTRVLGTPVVSITAAASATSTSVAEGGTISVSGSGSTAGTIGGALYSVVWSWDQLDSSGYELSSSDPLYISAIATAGGTRSSPGVGMANFGANPAHFDVSGTAPQVNEDTVLRFRLRLEARRTGNINENFSPSFSESVVEVTVTNAASTTPAPTANAGSDASANDGSTVTLTGTGMRDSSDTTSTLSYAWTQVTGESDTTALTTAGTITNANALSASFTAPNVTGNAVHYFFQFTVTATQSGLDPNSHSDIVRITVRDDDPPSATINTAGGTVTEGAQTSLSGTATANALDAGGDLLLAWTSSPSGPTFGDASAASTTVTWPQVSTDTQYTIRFRVSDRGNNRAEDTVMFTVQNAARPTPTANAGTDAAANDGDSVTLSGSGTRGSGDTTSTLSYAWVQVTSESDRAVLSTAGTITNANTASASFTAPNVLSDTDFFFQLTVTASATGDADSTATDVVKIAVEDTESPTATISTAGATVNDGTTTQLNGTVTANALDSADTISASWSSSPAGVSFANANAASTTATWPDVSTDTTYTLTLTATDSGGNTGTATVQFIVQDTPLPANATPTVTVGADQTVDEGAAVTLAGNVQRAASDSAGVLDYAWVQITSAVDTTPITTGTNHVGALTNGSGTPATSPLGQSNASFTAPSITASPFTRTYHFQLTGGAVDSGVTSRATATQVVSITVNDNTAPSANISTAAATVDESTTTTMAATGSDSESDTVTYAWTVSPSGPTITDATVLAAVVSWPTQAASTSTAYTLTLTVEDSVGNTATDTVQFTVRDTGSPTATTAGSDTSATVGTTVNLDASDSLNAAGSLANLGYQWIQTASASSSTALTSGDTGYVALAAATSDGPSFTAPSTATTLYFLLTVTDTVTTRTATARVTVAITLQASSAPTVNAGSDQTGIDDFDSGGTATTITLAGSATKAAGTGTTTFTYAWTQVTSNSGGAEITSGANWAGTITNANMATATVSAPDVATTATYYFQLSVTATESGKGPSAAVTDVVAITVTDNEAPAVAFTPAAGNVDEGSTTTFANTSSDPDGDTTLTYAWSVNPASAGTFGDPAGTSSTPATLAAPNIVWAAVDAATRSLSATVRLTVTDSQGNSGSTDVTYTVLDKNGVPTAVAFASGPLAPYTPYTNNRVLTTNTSFTPGLNARNSRNAGGGTSDLTYAWIQTVDASSSTAIPTNHPDRVQISNANTSVAQLNVHVREVSSRHFLLTVTDTQTGQTAQTRLEIMYVLPSAVIVDQIGASATQAAVSEGGGFGFRATRRDGVTDVDGELTIVATLSATPLSTDNDYETADFAAATGNLVVAAADENDSGYTVINVQNDTLLEGTEAFRVTFTLMGSTIPVIVDGTSSNTWDGEITDADSVTASIARSDTTPPGNAFTEGGAGAAGTAVFTVTVAGAELTADADVTFTVSGGTPPGTTGNDYTVTPAADAMGAYTLTVTPSSGNQTATGTITLTQVDDNMLENDETITVTLTAASSAGTVSVSSTNDDASATLTSDDMAVASIARATDGDGFTERASGSAAQTSFTVTLGAELPGNVTIPFTVSGTGITAADYNISAPSGILASATGGSLTINAGVTTGTITIDASDDLLLEGDETLTVELGTSITGGGTLDGTPVAVTRHSSDYTANATLSEGNTLSATLTAGADFTEDASGAGGRSTFNVTIFHATLSVATTQATTVNFTVTGCGAGGEDCTYTPSSGVLNIDSGDDNGQIVITQASDNFNEPDETITVTLTGASSAGETLSIPSGGASDTATLMDDDDITVTISRASGTGAVDEAGSVDFTVALSGGIRVGALTVPFGVTGGLLGAEYDITAPPGIPAADTGGEVVFPAADPDAATPIVPTATDSMTITVDLLGDDVNEDTETLIVTGTALGATGLRTANGGGVAFAGGGGNTESVDVSDDDDITVTLVPASGTDTDTTTAGIQVNEGTTVTLTVTMDHASAADVSFIFTSAIATQQNQGDAMDSDNDATTIDANDGTNPDFTPMGENSFLPSASVVVLAGQTTANITLAINADRIREAEETLTVALMTASPGSGAGTVELGSPVSQDLLIAPSTTSAHLITLAGSGSPTSLDEGAAATTFTITRSGPAITMSTTLDITWTFGAGDTVAADFQGGTLPTNGTVMFSGSETTKTFTIDPAEDALAEGGADGGEEFTLTLSAPSTLTTAIQTAEGGVQIVTAPHRVQIVDPDDALVIAIHSLDNSTVNEDATSSTRTATWRISVTGATSTEAVTVPFRFIGTGITVGDYNITAPTGQQPTAFAGEIEIASGMGSTASNCSSCGTITIEVTDDNLIEGDESLDLMIETPTGGGGLIALSAAVTDMDTGLVTTRAGGEMPATIADDDTGTVSIARTDTDGFTEDAAGAAGTAIFTVTLTGGALSADLDVAYTVAGCGGGDEDCSDNSGGNVAFVPGNTSGTLEVLQISDNLNEDDETITVTLDSVTTTGTVNIASSPGNSATAMLEDDDDLTVTASRTTGQEATADEGDTAVSFTVSYSGGELTGALMVPFTIGGTGITAGDYDITAPSGIMASATGGTLTIPVSTGMTEGSGVITVTISDDALNEAEETLALSLTTASVSTVGTVASVEDSATRAPSVTISQSDNATVSVARTDPSGSGDVTEGTSVTFTVTLTASSGDMVSVPWTATMGSQANNAGEDANSDSALDLTTAASGATTMVSASGVTTVSGTLAIPANTMSGTVVITPANDGLAEGRETFVFEISAPMGGSGSGMVALGSPPSATVGVSQNDAAAHIVEIADIATPVSEGSTATFTLTLPAVTGGNARSQSLTLEYTVGGEAESSDFTDSTGGTVTFPATGNGSTEQTVEIAITDDMLNEGDETLTVTLGAVTMRGGSAISMSNSFPGGAIGRGDGDVTISANDPITYSIGATTTGTEPADAQPANAQNMTFTVNLSAASEGGVTIPFTIAGTSTAEAGSDYTAPGAPLQFEVSAGGTSDTVEIALLSDSVHEGDETIVLTLGATPTLGAGAGTVTLSSTTGEDTGTGTIGGNDALTAFMALGTGQASAVGEGAPVTLGVRFTSADTSHTSAGPLDVTITTSMVQQNANAMPPAAVNTGGAGADIALPDDNCRDGDAVSVTVMADGSGTTCFRIPAGSPMGTALFPFAIGTLYDGLDEDGADNMTPGEEVTVTMTVSSPLTNAPAITVSATMGSSTFTINNLDSQRQLSVAASASTVAEGDGSNTVSWSLSMTGAAVEAGMGFDVAWEILASSTAGAGDTTGTRSGTVSVPAGYAAGDAAIAITTLTIVDDALNEGPETLVLEISEALGSPLETAGGRPDTTGPATTISAASATATINANDPIAVSLARRALDTGRLVNGVAANYVATLGATASTALQLSFTATLGGSALTVDTLPVDAGQSQATLTIPAATIDAATAAASGEVMLAVSVSGVTGAPSGATAAAAADGSESAADIGVVGWELSLAPASSVNSRIQVGEGGALSLTASLRGTPAPTALMIPWSVTAGVTGASPACGADASADDFMGGAFPSDTLDLSGQASGMISAQTAMDNTDESMSAECFTLSLGTFTGTNAGAVVVEGGSAAYAEIADALRTIAAAVTSATVEEGGTVMFTITMRGTVNPGTPVEVPWTLSGPDGLTLSGEGSDLGAGAETSGTVIFGTDTVVREMPAGVSMPVSVAIADDVLNEGPEMLRLTIGNVPENAGGQDGAIPGTLVSTATATATVSASDPIAVSLARRSGDTARLVNGDAARFTATLGATSSPGLMLGITATLGSGSVTVPTQAVTAGSTTWDFEIPACDSTATPPVTTGCLDAATAAASGEVQLAVSVSSVTGAPTGATAAPHATDAGAGDIPMVGWELSLSPTGSATQREQVGEGGPFVVTVTLRGTPGPGDLDIPWSVTSGVSAMGQTCAGSASPADFMGNALPEGTLTLDDLTTGTITVQTASDMVDESNPDPASANPGPECFTLALGTLMGNQAGAVAVVGASEAYAEIADALRTLAASVVNSTVDEDSGTAAGVPGATVEFTITMRGTVNPGTPVEVPWTLSSPDNTLTLSPGGSSGIGANSLATLDLGTGAAVSGTVTFPMGTDVSGAGNTMMVRVPIAQDALNEGPERLQLAIGNVPPDAGGMQGNIPGTLVSTRETEATVSASDDITVFLAPDPNQGTLTAGEAARYTVSFGTTMVNGQVVPIVPTTEVRIPLTVMVGTATVTIPPAAAGGGNAQVEAGPSGSSGQVVVPIGATQVTVEIPPAAIDAQGQTGTPMLTVAAQTPMGTPAGAEARPATAQDAADETQRTGQTVTETPPPAQVAGWELTVAQPDMDQAPEGTGYRVTFSVEGDTAALSASGIQIPWSVASRAAQMGGQQAVAGDFGPSRATPPAYTCGAPADGACTSLPTGTVNIAQGAAALTTLVIEIFDDGVEEGMTPEGFSVSLGALAGSDAPQTQVIVNGAAVASGAVLGDLLAEIPALRVDLSIANAVADEGANAEFVLTLANFSGGERTTQPIAVTFALASGPQPGGAQSGVDFTPPASLTTRIAAGATEGSTHTIPVWLVPDGLPEPPETFTMRITAAAGGGGTVRLVDAAGAEQAAIAATGTISGAGDAATRRGERVSTLVSVLDRSTAILAADAIGQRLDRGMPGSVSQSSQLSIANRNLLGSGEANARAAASDLGLALYGAPGMGGAAAGVPGEGAGVEAAGAFGGLGVGLSGGANLGRNMALPTLAELLNGSSFNFGAAAWTDLSTLADDVEVWGSGGYTDLSGDPQQGGSKLDYSGDNFAFFVGADRPLRPDLLAGVAVGYSVGDLDFTDTSDGFTTKGNLSTSMLSVHPYVGWWLTPNLNTWLMLGYGSGSVDVDETDTWALGATTQTAARTLPGNSDSNMWMIATGVAGRVQVAQSTGVKLSMEVARVHSELDAARFDDGALLPKLSAHSLRMGGEAEVNHQVQIGMVQIRPFVSARMRIETGDAVEQGAGQERDAAFDVGGGVSAVLPDLGIDGRIAVSGQLNETGHEERRVSVDLNYDLSGDSQGLTLAVQTAIRQRKTGLLNGLGAGAFGGVGGASSLGGSLASGVGQMEQSISGEIGYGMAFQQFGRSGLLTPYGRFDLGQDDSLYAAGLRLNANSGLSLGLEGVLDPEDSYQLRLTGQLNF